jgi:two-component system, LytTR family, sensor histidine kinase AlgZ
MHPILARSGRLGLYLLAWTPLAGMLILLLAGVGRWGWMETLAAILPLCLVYAFVCLSAWYPVRATPVERFGLLRLSLTHLTAAALVSSLWVLAGSGWALALSSWAAFRGFDQRFRTQVPLLFGTGALLYLLSVALHYALAAFEASRQAEDREAEARVLAREAELKALKAQVNPHFLFNSLHSISALTSVDAAKSREMCILLSDFLRSTLGLGEKTAIPLDDELALVRSYLAVEKVRFGARLNVEEVVEPDCLRLLVPPLLLQPLVENAVTHGIGKLLEGGSVRIGARRAGGALVIIIENSFDPESVPSRRNGLGLANVRKRLEAYYGNDASLDARGTQDRYVVELSLPDQRRREGA